MKKTGLVLLSAVVALFAMANMCFAVTLIPFPTVGMRDGKKTCDVYYDADSLFQQEDGLIGVVTVLDFTPWGVQCRLKEDPGFPPNATMIAVLQMVNLKTNQLKEIKAIYFDARGNSISEVTLDSDWYTPPPGKLSEVPIEVARNWLGQKEGEEVTVIGKLTILYAIGGESLGWAVELDSPLQVEGKTLNIIEIDLLGKKINLLAFKGDTVKVTGRLAKRHGTERGEYWVIEFGSISTI